MTSADHTAAHRESVHAETASTLWHERELLEHLLFTLTCQQLVLANGLVRFLPPADNEVRAAVDALTDCELRRAISTTELALLLGLPADATLEQIAARADTPWDELFAEHRTALRTLADEIATASGENRRLLAAGARLLETPGAGIDGAPRTSNYSNALGGPTGPVDAVLFDRQA